MSQRNKTRIRETTEAGCTGERYASSLLQEVRGGVPAIRKTEEVIDYSTGSTFNECMARKEKILIGVPMSHCSFGDSTLQVIPGSPEYVDGYGKQHPAVKPIVTKLDSRLLYVPPVGTAKCSASEDEIAQARFDAHQRLKYLVPAAHMNYGQALMELKDTKSTLAPLIKLTKFGAKVARKGGLNLVTKSGKRIWKKLDLLSSAASMASAYLWYTFGVEPTVSDVKTYLQQCEKGTLRVRGTKQRVIPKDTVMVERYSVRPKTELVGSKMFADMKSATIKGDGATTDIVQTYRLPPYRTYLHFPVFNDGFGTGRITYVTGERGAYFTRMTQTVTIDSDTDLLQRMWWNCPVASSLWELTPFSFLIDWFVDIGKTIKNLEHMRLGRSFANSMGVIWHSCQTYTSVYEPVLRAAHLNVGAPEEPTDWGSGGSVVVHQQFQLGQAKGDESIGYSRKIDGDPSPPMLALSDSVKAYQISSGMALLLQFANSLR